MQQLLPPSKVCPLPPLTSSLPHTSHTRTRTRTRTCTHTRTCTPSRTHSPQEFFSCLPQSITRAALERKVMLRSTAGKHVSPRDTKVRVCMDPQLAQLLKDPELQVQGWYCTAGGMGMGSSSY